MVSISDIGENCIDKRWWKNKGMVKHDQNQETKGKIMYIFMIIMYYPRSWPQNVFKKPYLTVMWCNSQKWKQSPICFYQGTKCSKCLHGAQVKMFMNLKTSLIVSHETSVFTFLYNQEVVKLLNNVKVFLEE